ncbi:MAG: RsmB/NOP family class I SAM-dependent RNA methyltransferase [Lachnospiraceae bacterium]|nr:RsmB/NOP family class I SAM-dependent RNA methyltransferase [Lachnospiraceae bacterium]
MKEDLGNEVDLFLRSCFDIHKKGMRINPLKADPDSERRITEGLISVPWEKHGYYYEDKEPGKSPLHAAGAYYIQEPSAMAPVNYLETGPGMCVLDLCAAPGGKSTQIAAALNGRGLLISNEIISDRARILSQNIERLGITNALVISHDPGELELRFPASFDRILVDAPCSGEGMFRRDARAAEEWSKDNVEMCAKRQEGILDAAASMLKPGGRLVYSTCTFSKAEDELQAEGFLRRHTDYHMISVKPYTGMRPGGIPGSIRIMPHDGYGEGHFIAVFERNGESRAQNTGQCFRGLREAPLTNKQKQSLSLYLDFLKETMSEGEGRDALSDTRRLFLFGRKLCLMPEYGLPGLSGLKVIRAGLELGEIRKERFVPSHSLALAMRAEDALRSMDLKADGEAVKKYLNGQSLSREDCVIKKAPASGDTGWTLVTASGISLGWGKASDRMLKNHYPKGLRINC